MEIKRGHRRPEEMANGIDSERSMYGAELVVLITLRIDHPSCSKEVVDAVVEPGGGVIPRGGCGCVCHHQETLTSADWQSAHNHVNWLLEDANKQNSILLSLKIQGILFSFNISININNKSQDYLVWHIAH